VRECEGEWGRKKEGDERVKEGGTSEVNMLGPISKETASRKRAGAGKFSRCSNTCFTNGQSVVTIQSCAPSFM